MKVATKEFKELLLNIRDALIILAFSIPAIILFIPTLGHSWRLTHIVDKIFKKYDG